ncbi:hypothetical protein [Vreelandella nigrificans]|uniref:hypothetical protein n=1 Tax=Vreelandella nigrificans TaxID=2042704 RepID=UPI0013FE3A39|nr:hypothetical protein [Halomonas nigrificans]
MENPVSRTGDGKPLMRLKKAAGVLLSGSYCQEVAFASELASANELTFAKKSL